MPKSPLFSALVRLTRDHRRALAAGRPLEVIRDEDARRALSRRGFLAGSAAVAAAATVPAIVASAAGTKPVKVAIVGGGLAGLTAALQLTDAGFAPTIYEAMGRFGGRMKSEKAGQPGCGSCHDVEQPKGPEWLEGQVTDVFGEFIDTGHETMQALARRFGLPLVTLRLGEAKGATETYFLGGKHWPNAEADVEYRKVVKALLADLAVAEETTWDTLSPEGRALDAMSLAQWIETRVPGGRASPLGKVLETAYAIEFGADVEDQSALNLVTLLGYNPSKRALNVYGESDEAYRISGGVDRLPKALVKHLEKRCTLELGRELTRVATRADGAVVLSFAGKPEVVVDHAILTLPFAALRNVDLENAGFDERKLRAIRELGYGKNGKLHLQFSERLWRTRGPWGVSSGQVYTDLGFQSAWESTRGQRGRSGILAVYTGGSGAAAQSIRHPYAMGDDLGVAADASRFLDQLEQVFPGLRKLWNGRASGGMPHLNRFWGGAYSYYRVGQWQAFGGHEPEPQGNVFFAGEHTTQEAQGYMEGAALTGTAAGKAVAKLLRGKAKKPA
jgi:monoamine oxidase